jgi:hypothetical protein
MLAELLHGMTTGLPSSHVRTARESKSVLPENSCRGTTSTMRRKNPHPKPGDGQVHPTARSLISFPPNFSTNRSSVHSEVPPRSILGEHTLTSVMALSRKPFKSCRKHSTNRGLQSPRPPLQPQP